MAAEVFQKRMLPRLQIWADLTENGMKINLFIKIAMVGLVLIIFASALTAYAAGMTIVESNIGFRSVAVSANEIKPAACSGLDLTTIVRGAGVINGTSGDDLILGSSGADTINGMGGNDCILGDGGNDLIDGGDGLDVCIGGNGSDSFFYCETEIQ
jgi:Ca2+-binding RTX toxin-like protein